MEHQHNIEKGGSNYSYMKLLTSYPELDSVLKKHANSIQKVLGDNFIGFYLQGSLATGDFDLTSDVDFIIVTEKDLSKKQVKEIQVVHTLVYNQANRWVKCMEYSFFPKTTIREHSSPYIENRRNNSLDRELWYFNNGSRTIERSDHCNTLVVRWTVREKGIIVLGPNPTTLIDPISTNELRKEIKDTLVGWGKELLENPEPYKNRFYQSYLVLNYCRMLYDLHKGEINSKLDGIKWAKSNLDSQWVSLINFCWQERQDISISMNQPANTEVFSNSLKFVRYAIEKGENYQIV